MTYPLHRIPTLVSAAIGALALVTCLSTAPAHAGITEPADMKRVADEPAVITAKWQTGNVMLRPFTCTAENIYVSGDKTAELWTTAGERLWQTELPFVTHFRPRTDGNVVVVGGRKGMAVLDAKTGELLWTYQVSEKEELSVPLLAAGRVIVGQDSWLKGFDERSGEEQWEFEITVPRRIAYPPIAYDDKWVIMGPGDGNLYAVDVTDGSLVWKNDIGKKEWQYLRQLYISKDADGRDWLVAGGYKDDVYGIDLKDGSSHWRMYAGNFINSHMVVDGETYFWSPTGWIYSLNIKNGNVRWRHLTDDHRPTSGY
ncbi:MAG TPA: PQQ-binding-like beta-propeller repeat protein, partial [Magnetovibrio sp.]